MKQTTIKLIIWFICIYYIICYCTGIMCSIYDLYRPDKNITKQSVVCRFNPLYVSIKHYEIIKSLFDNWNKLK